MSFTGIVLVADVPNKNNHIYPKSVLEDVVAKFKDDVENRRFLGQIDFPNDSLIHFDQASHMITELKMEGANMVATIETINTPQGRFLEKILSSGAKVALRPYGIGGGQVDDEGNLILDQSYKMVSISVVDAEKAA